MSAGAGTGDNTGPVPHCFQDGPQQLDFLPVGGGSATAGGARDHQTVAPLIDQVAGAAPAVAVSREPSPLNGVTIAVSRFLWRAATSESDGGHGSQGYLALYPGREQGSCSATRRLQASVANGWSPSSAVGQVVTSASANTAGATAASWRRHSMASRRISHVGVLFAGPALR